jgi:phospholipid-binding lipoprotein MlaA
VRFASSRWGLAIPWTLAALLLGACGTVSGGLTERSARAPAAPAAPGLPAVAEAAGLEDAIPPLALLAIWDEAAPDPVAPAALETDGAAVLAAEARGLLAQRGPGAPPPFWADAPEEYDPWEPFNQQMFELNRGIDRLVLKPMARAYDVVVPDVLKQGFSNAFDNLRVVPRVANSLLQGKLGAAGREVVRFVINSVVGIGGLFDVATQDWGLEKSPEDFGQTLARWGAGPGPYVVLPLLPPLTVRDGIGAVVDALLDPLTYLLPFVPTRLSMRAGETVNDRALTLELFQGFEESTLDLYSAVRNAYLQRRLKLISE